MNKSNKSVLIVDDEDSIRQSFADHFDDHLWNTIQAESAENTLELIATHQADGVIVDIRLPGMNGNAFIRKAIERVPALVFVICTGSPEYHVPEDLLCLRNAHSKVFRKPIVDITIIEQALLKLILEYQRPSL